MSEKLGDAILELRTDSKKFDKGLDKAGKKTVKLESKLKRAAKFAKSLKVQLIAIGAAIVVGVGITKAIQRVTNLGDEIAKMSLKTGIATETLSSFRLVMNLGGTDIKSFAKGIKTLSKNMFDLSTGVGEEARKAFDDINVSALNLDGTLRDNLDVMFDIADAFSAMEGGARKSAVASALFGRAGLELIPTLNMGSQAIKEQVQLAKDLGLQFSTLEGKQMEAFTDAVEILTTAFFALWQRLIINITPALTKFANILIDTTSKTKTAAGEIRTGFDRMLNTKGIKAMNAELDVLNSRVFAGTSALAGSRGFAGAEPQRAGFSALGVAGAAELGPIEEAAQQFEILEKTGTSTFDALENAVTGWASSFSSTMTDVLFGAEVTFGNIFESFARMITQMVIQTQIISPLLQGFNLLGRAGLQGSLTSLFGGGGGFDPAGILGTPQFVGPLPSFDKGGIVPGPIGSPSQAIVHGGEEVLTPSQRGGGNVEINIIGAPEGTRVQEGSSSSGGRRFDVILDEQVANIMRPGTKTASAINKTFNMSQKNIRR